MVRHGEEPDVDLAFLAATDAIDRGAHVVIDAAPRHAAENAKPMPVSIEQHLVGLEQIGAEQEGTAMRQLDMGDLQLGALSAEDRIILAPVELERLACAKGQGDEGAAPRRLLLPLAIGAPGSGKGGDPIVGPREAESDQIGMELLQRPALLARFACFRLQSGAQLLGEGIELAWPCGRRELRLHRARIQILLDGVPRQAGPPRDLA